MAASGDWVTPRLYGQPWFEKPPLLYWGGALFFKLLGEGHPEVAARLPSAISALLLTLALGWLAWRAYGKECALWVLLLLPSSVAMIGFSRAAATDMPFAAMLTISLVSAAVVLDLLPGNEDTPFLPPTPWGALLLFGLSLGLAVLAKGPAAVVLAGGAVFLWALRTKRWRDALRLFHPAAVVAFCLTALPWYIVCARRNPDFLRVFIIEHNFKRFLTPEFQHVQPVWFYLPVLLIALLPWLSVALWCLASGLRARAYSPLASLLVAWAVFCIIFFSLSKSKLPGYILPAIPALGLLVARGVAADRAARKNSFRMSGAIASLAFVAAALYFFAAGHLAAPASHSNGRAANAYALLALALSLANLLLVSVPSNRSGPLALAGSAAALPILVCVLFAPYFVGAAFDHDPSGRSIGNALKAPRFQAHDLFLGPMRRGKRYGVNFYAAREIPEWNPAHPKAGLLVLDRRNCAQLVPAPFACSGGEELVGNSGAFAYFVSEEDSLDGAGRGRQPQ